MPEIIVASLTIGIKERQNYDKEGGKLTRDGAVIKEAGDKVRHGYSCMEIMKTRKFSLWKIS